MAPVDKLLILAAGLQVALAIFAMVRTARARVGALRTREVRVADVALDTRNYPERLHKLQNNVSNQFETPTLFLAAIAIALGAGLTSAPLAALAYAWLASRVAHMAIQTGSNHMVRRFRAFVAGLALLAAMWILLIGHALFG